AGGRRRRVMRARVRQTRPDDSHGGETRDRFSTATRLAFLGGPMLSMIDSSVVNVAVPVIVRELHTSLSTAAWTVSGYLLGLACGLAATPWLARRFGTMRAYQAALLGFILASAACAAAPSATLLIVARVVQGLAGAPMVPLAMGLLLDNKTGARSMPASAGLLLFAAPALGPAIGGVLISGFGWPSSFLIHVPGRRARGGGGRGGPGGGGGGGAGAKQGREAGAPGARLDVPGLLLLAAGLGLATYGASQGPDRGWLSAAAAPAWAGGLALIAGYLWWARRRTRGSGTRPAVNLTLLASRRRSVILALACVASVVLFA